MILALIILGIVSIILLFLFILQKREIDSISKQLDVIISHDSNELIHSKSGIISAKFINKINNLLKKVNETQRDYNRKNHNMEQMITNISHDLRTPLTSAMGYINIVLNSNLPDSKKEIRIVEQRLLRLEELINSFFELSVTISRNKEPEKTSLNIISVLQESMVHYYDDFCNQNREIQFICDKPIIFIDSNANMLMRIFDNLIGNAYKHSDNNLTITVIQSDSICICFKNNLYDYNIDVTRIFDEFYTTDISRTNGNTGLGLAIAKQFTEILGGTINVEYENNVFAVTIML